MDLSFACFVASCKLQATLNRLDPNRYLYHSVMSSIYMTSL